MVDADLTERGSQLRLIANYAVGYNNIDLHVAAKHGIVVRNTPHSVVELLPPIWRWLVPSCTRRICEWDRLFRRKNLR